MNIKVSTSNGGIHKG